MKHIEPVTVSNRHAATAYRPEGARSTRAAPRAVATGDLRVVDIGEALLVDVTDKGRKFPAGMHLPIGKEGEKVKGGSTPKTRTPAKRFHPPLLEYDVDQVVLQAENRVIIGGLQVLLKKAGILIAGGELQVRPLSYLREAVEGKGISQLAEHLCERQDVIDVVLRECEHHHRVDAEVAQDLKELDGTCKVSRSTNIIIVFREPFQADLKMVNGLNGEQFLYPLPRRRIPKNRQQKTSF